MSSSERKAILTPYVTQEAYYFNRQIAFLSRFAERYHHVTDNQTHVAFQSYDTSNYRSYSYRKLLYEPSGMGNNYSEINGNDCSDSESWCDRSLSRWSYNGGTFDPLTALMFSATSVLKTDESGIFSPTHKDAHTARMHVKNVILMTISNTANLPSMTEQEQNAQIVRAVRLVKMCTGAEIITVGLHTEASSLGTSYSKFEQVLNLISCWNSEEREMENISEFVCDSGECYYPSSDEQETKAQTLRSTSCPSAFFMPESGDFETLIDEIKERIRTLAREDPEETRNDKLTFTEHLSYYDRKLYCRQMLAKITCSSSGQSHAECADMTENIRIAMQHEDL